MKNYESLLDALFDVRARGYKEDFNIEPGCLYCGALDLRLYPAEFSVDEVHRFEEDSNPGDNSVLYAISSSGNVRGTVVDGFGAYADNMSFDMARKLRVSPHVESLKNI
jgi:hypothetical protein